MDIETLTRKHMMAMVLKIRDNPGATKTELMRDEHHQGNDRNRFLCIQTLIEEGMAEVDPNTRGHNRMCIRLTPKGQILATLIDTIAKL